MVDAIQRELLAGDLLPMRAREVLVELTALLGTVMTEVRDAEIAFNAVLLAHLDGSEAANRAKIRAQTTPEYRRLREAKDVQIAVTELARALKSLLRSLSDEMRMTA
jgi:hypothetical protein